MRTIEAYKAADGSLYENEKDARAKDEDLLGAELAELMRLFWPDLPHDQECYVLHRAMKKRAEMLNSCRAILDILEHSEEADED